MWQHQEMFTSLVLYASLTPCSWVLTLGVYVCVHMLRIFVYFLAEGVETRQDGEKQDVECITRWTLDTKATSYEGVCVNVCVGGWVCMCDLSGLLTLSLYENNAECSRKSRGICILTTALLYDHMETEYTLTHTQAAHLILT